MSDVCEKICSAKSEVRSPKFECEVLRAECEVRTSASRADPLSFPTCEDRLAQCLCAADDAERARWAFGDYGVDELDCAGPLFEAIELHRHVQARANGRQPRIVDARRLGKCEKA